MPGQRVVALVAYDGVQPRDLGPDDRELARRIFGDVDEVSDQQRSTFVAICGGRGGKTLSLVAWRLLHGMFVRDLSTVQHGQRARALIISLNDRLRQETVNYAIGAMRRSPLRDTLILPKGATEESTVASFAVRRPDGHIVSFEGGVAAAGGYGARGTALTDVAFDEFAFFRDSSSVVNDKVVFDAAAPRVLRGGQAIVTTTPWAKSGMAYEFWARNMGHPKDALVAHAPTVVLNDHPDIHAMVARERLRDPDNARREFDAEFMTTGTLLFFESDTLERAQRPCPIASPSDLVPGDVVAAGADFGFRSDSSALVMVVRRCDQVHVVDVLELRPDAGAPLEPGRVVAAFAATMQQWGCRYLMADGHYRESITEHLRSSRLSYVPAPSTPSEPYVRTRNLLREHRLTLPSEPRLIQQMREVMGRPQSGGGLSITHPRWSAGGHGDVCAALVLAVDQAGGFAIRPPPPEHGSDEWWEQRRQARRKELADQKERPHDRGRNAHWRRTA